MYKWDWNAWSNKRTFAKFYCRNNTHRQVLNDKSFNLTINPSSVNVYDVRESAKKEFIELSNGIVGKIYFVKLSID